jgi:hypothetical protein
MEISGYLAVAIKKKPPTTPTMNKRTQSNKTIRTPPTKTNNNIPTPTHSSTFPVKLITQVTPIQMDITANQHVNQLSPRIVRKNPPNVNNIEY